jgi:hypothetical protein
VWILTDAAQNGTDDALSMNATSLYELRLRMHAVQPLETLDD